MIMYTWTIEHTVGVQYKVEVGCRHKGICLQIEGMYLKQQCPFMHGDCIKIIIIVNGMISHTLNSFKWSPGGMHQYVLCKLYVDHIEKQTVIRNLPIQTPIGGLA